MIPAELLFIGEAYYNKQNEDFKQRLTENYLLASNISEFIWGAFSNEKMRTLQEMYPEVFNDKPIVEDDSSQEDMYKLFEMQMIEWANRANKQRAERALVDRRARGIE